MGKKPLLDEIKEFQKDKKKLVPVLLVLGVLGLLLPILPGAVFLLLGFLLLFPQQSHDLLRRIREKFRI